MNLQISVTEPIAGNLHLLLTMRGRFTSATWLTPDDARTLAAHLRTGEPIPNALTRNTGFIRRRGQLNLELSAYDTVSHLTVTLVEALKIAEALQAVLNPPPGPTRREAIKAAGEPAS